MTVYARILLYILSGMLLKAGMPPHIVDMIAGDASLHIAIDQALSLILGGLVAWIGLAWRKLAIKMKWST